MTQYWIMLMAKGMAPPRQVSNRRRTREGPEPACVQTPLIQGWHTQEEKGGETQRRKNRAAGKGKWPLRGRQSSPILEVRPGEQARLVKEGQNSGEMGGSSPWTRPSAPKCGDTLQALAGDQRSIQGGDRPRLSPGSPTSLIYSLLLFKMTTFRNLIQDG